MITKTIPCLIFIFSIWVSLFSPFVAAQNSINLNQSEVKGLQFRISEAAGQIEKPPQKTPVSVENLSSEEANAIFERLPKMPPDTEDGADFRIRADSLKPPRTGNVIPIKFPADEPKNAPDIKEAYSKTLEVERFSPSGNTPLATDLSVTFSQPMIAVGSQAAAGENVPVKLSPEVKGKWRWLGTQTLILDAETRLPMATTFTATIPGGTRSVVGGTLAKDFSWTFSTPPPTVEKFAPDSKNQTVDPQYALMAVKFNQEIDGAAVLPKISVTADGKRLPIELIPDGANQSFSVVYELGEINPKHLLVFRTSELLPRDSEITVVFEKGIPSAEGSAVSQTEQSFSFRTYPPLKFVKSFCGYSQNKTECEPSDDFRIEFNHSLYPAPFEPGQISIEPPIEDVKIIPQGGSIIIQGKKKPNTIYKVTVSVSVRDFYKQTLGAPVSADFKVGIDKPQFFAQGGDLLTLDPFAKPVFSVYSKNQPGINVRLYAVTPENYVSYRPLLRAFYQNRTIAPKPDFGRLVFDKTVEIKSDADVLTETRIDISEALAGNFGHAILIAEPTFKNKTYNYENLPVVVWIQATNIGLDAVMDYEKMTALATELKTGKPLSDLQISLNNDKYNVLNSVTNEKGMADFELVDAVGRGFLLVKNGGDSAILREDNDYAELVTDWRKKVPYEFLRWFVFDDRKMYRPAEEVSVKGYIRRVTGGRFTDIAGPGDRLKSVNYILSDPRNNEIARGTVQLNAFGAFDLKLKLPENINLGYQSLQFWSDGFSGSPEFTHNFQVQEFRRPEFEVLVEAETPAPYIVGNTATLFAEAKYYTGGALSGSALTWRVSATATDFSPPNHDSFTFGTFVPWWRRGDVGRFPANYNSQYLNGTTDVNGKHRIDLELLAADPARPYRLQATAEVQDVNRQMIADTKNFLIHPSDVYVGLRSLKTFVRPGETLGIEAIAADLDGKNIAGAPINMTAVLKDWQRFGNNWQQVGIETQTCQVTSAESAVSCDFAARQGGTLTISATVLDARERPNTSELTVWVAGGNAPPNRGVELETIEMIPDKKEYAPGETAEILVNAPFFPAEAVMTLERNGIIKTERLAINESSTVLQIPIEERYLPNVHVKIDLVGATRRTDDKGEIDKILPNRPAVASGELNLDVSKASRKLNVAVEPLEKTIEPGGKTNINVEVKDASGQPVADAEIALIAVDEGVLALTGYKIQNPLEAFYQQIYPNVAHYHSREKVLLGNTDTNISAQRFESLPVNKNIAGAILGGRAFQFDGKADASDKSSIEQFRQVYKDWLSNDVAYIVTGEESAQINVRRNFDALAIFAPSVITDENGRAAVELKLPDNLTRYRITAVAVTREKKFGLGESNITARQSLQIRPSPPRFINFGDRFELPVVVQNQTDSPLSVNVAIRAANAGLTGGNGRKVTVPANDRVEIRFPVSSEKAGIARFQIGGTSGKFADAAEIVFPVYTPATTEAFATYGTTEENGAIVQTILAPKDVFPQFGGLEVTTSSTQLQELTDAFIYLQSYPFQCSEQVSSRVLSVAALRDVLTAFDAKDLPTKAEIEAKMTADIGRLKTLQHPDGGWSFWRSDDESFPYVSVHVAHALARAKEKGYAVPNETIARALNYLKNIESKYPADYSPESRSAISAYTLYVRDLLGDKDAAKAKTLLKQTAPEKLSPETLGWLLSVLAGDKNSAAEVETIKQNLLNRVTETAGNAHFITNYTDGEYVLLSSARRADGIVLEALLKADPANDLIPKIVRGLLAGKTKGRWQSTQENAFVLLALDKYFQIYEKTEPDFVARVWLGKAFAGEQKFTGRSIDSQLVNVPMNYLQTQKAAQNLILDKQGSGRLYYRIGLKYAPKDLKLAAADYGFAVSRTFEAVDDENDVRQNADANWTFKAGSLVRVRIKMIAPTRRYHVALVDNLPAGIEIVDTALAISGRNYLYEPSEFRRGSYWFQHQNLRDNRAEAFTTLLREGIWNYSYIARATTPGDFVVPPAKAEEMYSPETFGRSKTDFVKVY